MNSFPFAITETVREFDGPAGWVYRARTRLDFHDGWITTLSRTKRSANGYPNWTHGVTTQSLTATGEWIPQCAARPVFKFESFEEAEYRLSMLLSRSDHGPEPQAEVAE